jgi:prolyl 4-hydroxylase
MTGLTTKTAELLQVQNYGIGGHYNPHWDHQIKRFTFYGVKRVDTGNRIATVLFYVSSI